MKAHPWHISVLIPARDEEQLLPRCLESVLAAREKVLHLANCDVVVAVNQSIDATYSLACDLLRGVGAVIRSDAGGVGAARAAAARVALQRRTCTPSQLWLANTDADCCVPSTWLQDQLALAESGVQAVAGVVDVDSFADHDAGVEERFRSSYLFHADGTHPHVHGANLGVRADAYLLAGAWADLSTAEDHDLWQRLGEVCAATRSISALRVITSGRRVGRAPLGFAGALAAHNEASA